MINRNNNIDQNLTLNWKLLVVVVVVVIGNDEDGMRQRSSSSTSVKKQSCKDKPCIISNPKNWTRIFQFSQVARDPFFFLCSTYKLLNSTNSKCMVTFLYIHVESSDVTVLYCSASCDASSNKILLSLYSLLVF